MFQRIIKIIFTAAVLLPVTGALAYTATAATTSTANTTNNTYIPFVSDKGYTSGYYAGIQAGYVYAADSAKYSGTAHPDSSNNNDLNSGDGGVFAGYGHVFSHGNLPYLGGEVGFNYRHKYNTDSDDLYGAKINAEWNVSADILPGFFLDQDQTTLVYLRLGVEGDQFKLTGEDSSSGKNLSDNKCELLYRAGAGIEHELVDHVYLRADYIFSSPINRVSFTEDSGKYSSSVSFNTFTIGVLYRF